MENKIGLIAGGGKLPVLIASQAVKNNYQVFAVGFEGFTSQELAKYSNLQIFKLGKISAPIEYLKKNGVNKAVMIGYIPHVNIFSDLSPDARAINLFLRLKDKTPKGIFLALEQELKKDGIELVNSAMFLEENFAKQGIIAGKKISSERFEDIKYGFEIAKKISAMDIGLSVIVKEKAIVAVEAMEGTDECIKRAGNILSQKKANKAFTLVKVARPDQDIRFDLPVIGLNTVKNMAENGGDIIAIEAGKTLIVDLNETIELARAKNITIVGVSF